MRKLKIIIFILSIIFIVNVKASNSFNLVCSNPKIVSDGFTNCDIMLNYDTNVSSVEFNFESELNLTFTKGLNGNITVNNNKVIVEYPEAVSINNDKILNVKISNNNNLQGDKKVSLKNIRVTSNDVSYSLDNEEETISIITKNDLSSNCNLKSLTIDGALVNGFSPNKYKYERIIVNKRIVFLDAVRDDDTSSCMGLGNALLKENENKDVVITVVAENGNQCTYTLGITYSKEPVVEEIEKSKNNNLENLELYNGDEKINFNFDNNKNSFNINVESQVTDLTIKAILQDEKASFTPKYGPRDIKLEEGKNTFLIKIEAENGESKTYTLNITREKSLSSDATLKSLSVNGIGVLLKNGEFNYEIVLPNYYKKTNILAVPNDTNAKVNYKNIDLVEQDNIAVIEVVAENGDILEYVVTISMENNFADLANEKFEKIEVVGYHLDFDINKEEYELKIDQRDDSIVVKAIPDNIDITVLNNTKLKDGSVVTVKVIDGDAVRNYKINIKKDPSMNTNISCYIFFIISVIILLLAFRSKEKARIKRNKG